MSRITTVDQALLLLRAELQRMAKTRPARPTRSAGADAGAGAAGVGMADRVRQLAAVESLSDEEFGRALIANLLADEFGETLVNDVRFRALASDVDRMIREDADGRAVLDRAVHQLRVAAGP